ncbi:guanine deaminase [Roseomonas sp. KE2513]|uniref:guanine deaminase n=1 Tax=Roseomonas sp. KE2513 TaxID=2479202 RepID=UPI0018DF2F3E|nr:guanine deaminase [Roseomonas sp. KE2513]MBI0536215.1 guanine deaminase [Roseomonas sp. KE2513]
MNGPALALRGPAFAFRHNPFEGDPDGALIHWPDALVVMRDGRIAAIGDHAAERPRHPGDMPVHHYPDGIIGPGFVDTHVHYPQLEMTGAYGETLLDWLARYTYPTEAGFADPAHCARIAALFLQALLRAGTTTAAVYCTVHEHSADALFAAADRLGLRLVAGKVLMDRNAPPELRDGEDHGIPATRRLIGRWHGRGRLLYAITPRFAPACTDAALEAAGRLWHENPGTYVQTHLCETEDEIAWVRELFPAASSYLDVYARAGLAGPRAVMGHAVHVTEGDLSALRGTGCGVAHCPSSNLFLGSGLFRLHDAAAAGVRVGLGSDVGAGTGLSTLRTLGDAYKVARLRGARLHPAQAFWLATQGGAAALRLEDRIGNLAPGLEADLVVLDPRATPELALRTGRSPDLADTLFALTALGDERAVRATYVAGRLAHDRDGAGGPGEGAALSGPLPPRA